MALNKFHITVGFKHSWQERLQEGRFSKRVTDGAIYILYLKML